MKAKIYFMNLMVIYTFLIFPLLPAIKVYAGDNESEIIDIIAPTIIHTPPKSNVTSGKDATIRAEISDNGEIVKSTLFFRMEGEKAYNSIEMVPTKGDEFKATIPGTYIKWPSIEYYIEVEDETGNYTLKGFASQPLVIFLRDKPAAPETESIKEERILTKHDEVSPIMPDEITPIETVQTEFQKPETQNSKPWYKKWWVWTVAGAVVAGAAIASASGGNSTEPPNTGIFITSPAP